MSLFIQIWTTFNFRLYDLLSWEPRNKWNCSFSQVQYINSKLIVWFFEPWPLDSLFDGLSMKEWFARLWPREKWEEWARKKEELIRILLIYSKSLPINRWFINYMIIIGMNSKWKSIEPNCIWFWIKRQWMGSSFSRWIMYLAFKSSHQFLSFSLWRKSIV